MINTLERRRYIRISDVIKLRYWQPAANNMHTEADHHHAQFMGIENQVQILLRHLPTQAHKFSELLQLINQKLNLLELRLNPPTPAFQELDVNLSGCGIAFAVTETYLIGQQLKLEMILAPYDSPVAITAEVVSCAVEPEMPKQLTLRLEFRQMHSQMEDMLVHYILKRQSQLLKMSRSQRM
jgi:hypothetical protein